MTVAFLAIHKGSIIAHIGSSPGNPNPYAKIFINPIEKWTH